MKRNIVSLRARVLMPLLAALTACSGDNGTAGVTGSPAAEARGSAAGGSPVFPEAIAKGFVREVTVPLPDGGMAGVGLICRGSGADVFYVGVNGATGLADGQHSVNVDKIDETMVFVTGAPDSGVGAGGAQSAFDEAEYTFTFDGLDLVITIAGCN